MTFHHDRKFFDATDYIMFAVTMIIPILIGVYYSFISKKKPKTVSEYLVGNRNMKLFPVSMSVAASCISGYYLIGPISEVYFYGGQYALKSITIFLASGCFIVFYLPTFYNLKLTSTFEYLEKRFDYKVRLLGSFLFLIKTLLNMAIWIYAPTVLFEQVTGIPLNVLIPICSGICIFYTFGGVRSVIWADTFQMIVMLLGIIIIIIVGVYDVGVQKIWELDKQGKRLNFFEFDPDPRLRQSFWMFIFGHTSAMLGYMVTSQYVVQRCVSVSTILKSKQSVMIQAIVTSTTIILSCCIGLMVYAAFHDCDPITAKKITKPDQLLPYFIMNLSNKILGLTSVVISISFCAALSSVSSGLNSAAGVILIDIIRPLLRRPISDAQATNYMKIISIMMGVFFTGITYSFNNKISLAQITPSLVSITSGSCLGILSLGVFLPWANANGAFIGGIAGGVMIGWMSIGSQVAYAAKRIVYSPLPLSISNCSNYTIDELANDTLKLHSELELNEPFFLYTISFHYYCLIGALTAIVVGMIVSYFTGFNNLKCMDPKLFSPVIQKHFKSYETNCELANTPKE